ncbi:MAG: hypothetical protein ACYDEB_13565 [Dehalococcoidia bacterium]
MSASLQSGFVSAVIIAAVLFAGRLAPGDDLARRLLQVSIGALLALAVFSGTTAFVRQPSMPAELQQSSSSRSSAGAEQRFIKQVNKRNTIATTINAAVGAFLVIAGVGALRRWKIVPVGWLLGGVLLVLFGGVATTTDASSAFTLSYAALIGAAVGGGDRLADILHFVVLLVSALGLSMLGLYLWDESAGDTEGHEAEAPAA